MTDARIKILSKVKRTLDEMMAFRGYSQKIEYHQLPEAYKPASKFENRIKFFDIDPNEFENEAAKMKTDEVDTIISSIYTNTENIPILVIGLQTIQKDKKETIDAEKGILPIFNSAPTQTSIKKIPNVILVTKIPLTDTQKFKVISQFNDTEFFLFENLYTNPINHFMSPEYVLLTKERTREFLENSKLNKSQIPIIKVEDPVSKWYGAKIGQVFKIRRNQFIGDSMARVSKYYRIVDN